MLASPGMWPLGLIEEECNMGGAGYLVQLGVTILCCLACDAKSLAVTPCGLPQGRTHCATHSTAGTACAAGVPTVVGAARAQGVAHRGASGGTADVHLAPPPGDGWLPREDTAVQQPPMARMVSWQDAHGKDLYTVCASERPALERCLCAHGVLAGRVRVSSCLLRSRSKYLCSGSAR